MAKQKYKWYEKGEVLSEGDFTRLYREGYGRTCQMFHKMGYQVEDCEELAQEVYLLLWRYRRDLIGSPVSFWMLKFYKVCSELKSGRMSDPIDTLITVRNSEREDLLGTHPAPDEDDELITEDMLKEFPPLAQEYFRDVLAGYSVREMQVLRGNTGIYLKIRRILAQPDVREKLLTYLRG